MSNFNPPTWKAALWVLIFWFDLIDKLSIILNIDLYDTWWPSEDQCLSLCLRATKVLKILENAMMASSLVSKLF